MMSDLFNTTFSATGISVYYGNNCAVDNVSLNLNAGQINAVIGLSLIHISEPTRPY